MRIFGKYFGLIWLIFSALVFTSVLISPLFFQYASIVSFAIPIVMVATFAMFVLSVLFNSRYWYYYLITLFFAWPYYQLTFSFTESTNSGLSKDFSVLNYNVKWFTEARQNNYDDVINWIVDQEADVLCFQEYYPRPDINQRLMKRGNYFDATGNSRYNVALFSKHPILSKGLLFDEKKLNNVFYADIKIKQDTVRFYSLHLESMGIDPEKLQDSDGIRNEYDDVKFKILNGSRARAKQIEVLLDHVAESPYPVVLAGDFNDVPYSYNYFKLGEKLKNAFEEKGRGLGATYNGKIPFLRIDNQFFGDGLELLHFHTLNNVNYSDHFPIMGSYRVLD